MNYYADTSKKLGQMLVERGWITGEQLIRAIQSQRMVGGRLGTCLLEMDVLTEDRLLDALADQLRVPAVRVEQLRGIESETLQLLPAKVASRCRAVPFFANRQQVNVATLDVHDLRVLDELAFCTDKKIVPHIANEVRIFEALEKYYGFELPRRYGHLLDRLNRSRYLWDESAKILFGRNEQMVWTNPEDVFGGFGAPALDDAAAVPAAPASPVVVSGFDPTPAEGFKPLVRAEELPIPATLDEVEEMLSRAAGSHQVASVVMRFASRMVDRVAMFRVRQGAIGGWKASGHGVSEETFQQFECKLSEASIFMTLDRGAEYHRGPLTDMPAHRRFLGQWGDTPTSCLMAPILVRGRMASVLYGDRLQADFSAEEVELFRHLAAKAAMAFELCILRKKIHHA